MIKKWTAIALLAMLLVSCKPQKSEQAMADKNPTEEKYDQMRKELIKRMSFQTPIDHFTFGIPDDPKNLNPLSFSEKSSDILLHNLYRRLCRIETKGLETKVKPDLAKEIKTGDNQNYTIVLDEAMWSDGQPVTAKDLAFTLDQAFAGETRYANQFLIDGKKPSYTIRSEHELVLTLPRPSQSYVSYLADLLVVPEHIYRSIGDRPFGPEGLAHLVGNKAYRLKESFTDKTFNTLVFRFEKNPYYKGPFNSFETLDFRVTAYKETDTSRYDMEDYNMQAGYMDASDPDAFNDDFYNLQSFEGSTVALFFNQNTEIGKNKEIRRAMSYLLQPSQVLGFYGDTSYVSEANTVFSPLTPYPYTDAQYNEVKRKEAIETFKKWQMGNPEFKLRFGFILDINNPQERCAITLQERFKQEGLNIELIPLFRDEYLDALAHPENKIFDFGLVQWPATDNADWYRHLFMPKDACNVAGAQDPALLALFDAADVEKDPFRRVEMYQKIQQKIDEEKIYIPMVWLKEPMAIDDRVQNIEAAVPDPQGLFEHPERLGFKPFELTDQEKKEYNIRDRDRINDKPYQNVNIKKDN